MLGNTRVAFTEEKKMQKRIAIVSVLCLGFGLIAVVAARQQDKSKRPSPPANATCDLPNGKTITVDYSSPRAKGRKIYGGLVPYGEVWRAGANEATTFVTTADVTVGGKEVPAGSYTMFAIPNPDKWTLIISKKTGEWGIPYPGEGSDFARVEMKVSKLPSHVEDFTIAFEKSGAGCEMRLDWETTRASIAIAEKK
jgi:Protein of unknown function (DUF2911)